MTRGPAGVWLRFVFLQVSDRTALGYGSHRVFSDRCASLFYFNLNANTSEWDRLRTHKNTPSGAYCPTFVQHHGPQSFFLGLFCQIHSDKIYMWWEGKNFFFHFFTIHSQRKEFSQIGVAHKVKHTYTSSCKASGHLLPGSVLHVKETSYYRKHPMLFTGVQCITVTSKILLVQLKLLMVWPLAFEYISDSGSPFLTQSGLF